MSLLEVCTSCSLISSNMSQYYPRRDSSLQIGFSVSLEYVMVLGECCPSTGDSSLNLIVLVFVSRAVSLSQVGIAFNVLSLSDVIVGVQ